MNFQWFDASTDIRYTAQWIDRILNIPWYDIFVNCSWVATRWQ